jgi:hypothetical protein
LRQQALIRFAGSDKDWALTYAFFCDELDEARAIERKRYFERWLKRRDRDERQVLTSAHLAVLRQRGLVPTACKHATLVPIDSFDEIAVAFGESATKDTINARRQGIDWVAFELSTAAIALATPGAELPLAPATSGVGEHVDDVGETGTAGTGTTIASTTDAATMPRLIAFACSVCASSVDAKACGACGKVCYCSVDCQRLSWNEHRHVCKSTRGDGPRTADHGPRTTDYIADCVLSFHQPY